MIVLGVIKEINDVCKEGSCVKVSVIHHPLFLAIEDKLSLLLVCSIISRNELKLEENTYKNCNIC